ncbi:hypothetical protein DS957_022865 [Vibrio harveyi]|uniref:Molecular chaperone n=2 Tax=Vibrio harveyi TaxID=669 RepID=A0A8B3DG26_VIBHA|nr:hypothetical protein [Vibrio harveyi]EKO3858712.1 hypothetical protein [Vibrio harveyi]RIW05315.1 hypothetical protein DS957_022865 [Vibrio harveyi]
MKSLPIFAAALISTTVSAMNVDTMLLVSDEYGNGVFTVSNNKPVTEFIQSNITQLEVKDGELMRTPYTESNFSDWRVTLTHPKMILESDRQKQVGVRSLCGNKCDFSEDQYYLVSFEPSPYDPKGKMKSAVTINFGYRPLFVIPAKTQKIDYTVSLSDGKLHINNTGNSFIRAYVDQCTDTVKEDCEFTAMSLSGRERAYELPKNITKDKLEVTIINHDESYRKKMTLKDNK